MVFNSFEFLVFFAIVVPLYYAYKSEKSRLLLLFFSSCYFYMAFVPQYILILFFLILTDFYLGLKIEESAGKRRKQFLILSIVLNLSTLFVFKYFNFAIENLDALARLLHWNYALPLLRFALPIGLSFHIFQSLSYVIEVYRGKQKAERNLGVYSLYVMFFPQLVAGPIERPQQLLYQFHEPHPFKRENVSRGLELMLIGFAKKLVLADNIAIIVDHIYRDLPHTNGITLILVVLLFSYQLYCDFSGYSDIAQGSALVLGYDLMNNFERPYSARSVTEFWRRWHISLSNWLRDYLYYPLVFSGPRTKARMYWALFITFVLIGLWHGANWTYVMLGVTHGVYLVVGAATSEKRKKLFAKLPREFSVVTTFILVSLSWVFFRAHSMHDAWYIFSHLGRNINSQTLTNVRYSIFNNGTLGTLKYIIPGIIALEVFQYFQGKKKTPFVFANTSQVVRFGWYYFLIFLILGFGYLGAPSFIYFQF